MPTFFRSVIMTIVSVYEVLVKCPCALRAELRTGPRLFHNRYTTWSRLLYSQEFFLNLR